MQRGIPSTLSRILQGLVVKGGFEKKFRSAYDINMLTFVATRQPVFVLSGLTLPEY